MSGTYTEGTFPLPNRNLVNNSNAVSTISAFPLAFTRKDMSNQERIKYTYEWITFENIWMYNYTVSTINGTGTFPSSGAQGPWQFVNMNERLSYSNGQLAHISAYPSSVATFFNIIF